MFIEITNCRTGKKELISLNSIARIYPVKWSGDTPNATAFMLKEYIMATEDSNPEDGVIYAKQSYKEIKRRIEGKLRIEGIETNRFDLLNL